MLESLGQLILESLITAIIVAGFLKIAPFEWERWRKEQDKKDEEREKWLKKVKNTLIDLQNNRDKLKRNRLTGSVPAYVTVKISTLNGYTQDYFAMEYEGLKDDLQEIHDKLVDIEDEEVDDKEKAADELVEHSENVVNMINDELESLK